MANGSDPMDGMQNAHGDKCPCCTTGTVIHQAVIPMVVKGEIILPHCYGVCDDCHRKQYVDKYGYTPEEAPKKVPKKKQLISDDLRFKPQDSLPSGVTVSTGAHASRT